MQRKYQDGVLALFLIAAIALFFSSGCSSISRMSNLPEADNVKMSRHEADKDCKPLGKVEGRSISKNSTNEEVLKDMQQEAANKGANYVQIHQYSATGGAVTGEAYLCP